ncbi:inorganic diphosphatase [Mycotypha africana]|uniref:inorganic diphosphatase n=1 Tax=Mycotypha africana TaxID=64632 RepID=UPI0023005314|nr:inorganic diphosphatase [Mycotypha africana]KAI8984146.1 inorganic diphosphatase [Mycotypha africana]
MEYTLSTVGKKYTPGYKIFIEKNGQMISPFHDIPLYADAEKKIVNMVVEIPRWTNAKFEISKSDKYNPIKQDVRKGKVRFVRNCFPYKGYIWNYGALPQTWEDPSMISEDTNAKGDNDPIDVCEIGQEIGYQGQIKQVKLLGVLGLLDDGETDWKLIAIDVKDPLAEKLNDIEDVEQYFPEFLKATRHWFKIYKIPDGKAPNQFAFEGSFKNKKYAEKLVNETHEAWQRLIHGKTDNKHDIKVANVTIQSSPYNTSKEGKYNEEKHLEKYKKKSRIADKDDRWYFIKSKL